jgi:hypothetical protein
MNVMNTNESNIRITFWEGYLGFFFNGFPFSVGCYSCRTRGGRDDENLREP